MNFSKPATILYYLAQKPEVNYVELDTGDKLYISKQCKIATKIGEGKHEILLELDYGLDQFYALIDDAVSKQEFRSIKDKLEMSLEREII